MNKLDPKAWYGTPVTAVMTQGMANGSDPNCKNMNDPRAAEWLKAHVAASPVYPEHGQLLFKYEWQQRFQLTARYLADQKDNGDKWAPAIDAQVKKSIADINENVIPDSSNPNLRRDLILKVQGAGEYAKSQNLYWAFAFFTYHTTASVLADIAQNMGQSSGNSDATYLTRIFQQYSSVLTVLDPSGYFTQQYMSVVNTFLSTNILPGMFGFLSDAMSFDLIKEYLVQFVRRNIANEDRQIAEAAAQMQTILAGRNPDAMLRSCIEALRNLSGAAAQFVAFGHITKGFVTWLREEYTWAPKVADMFGSLLLGGITGLSIFNLFTEFKSWDKLTAAQRTQLILNTLQFGLQVFGALAKRGIRIFAVFGVPALLSDTLRRLISSTQVRPPD